MIARRTVKGIVGLALTLVLAVSFGPAAFAETTLRAVMHSDLKIVDPIWTTAYMSRNYGYMVYDTLFAMDAKLAIKPQMVDSYSVSDDNLTYTFTLRNGLLWHDGAPVKAEDAVASIKRWGQKDSLGQKLLEFTKEFKVVDDKTFQLILKEPFGLVLMALAKPSSNVPFIMPNVSPTHRPMNRYRSMSAPGSLFSKKMNGNRVTRLKLSRTRPTNRAVSRPAGLPAPKLSRWTGLNGFPCPTTRRPSTH